MGISTMSLETPSWKWLSID